MNKKLVLCSGGLDSAVLVDLVRSTAAPGPTVMLFVDYMQPGRGREMQAVQQLSTSLKCELVCLRQTLLTSCHLMQEGSALTKDEALIPCRNLQITTLAVAYACANRFHAVYLGNIKGGAYSDNSPEFAKRFTSLLQFASTEGFPLSVLSPMDSLSKSSVVALGSSLGVPFELTWSCYGPGPKHCGVCPSCVSRRNAFAEARIPDPTEYEK